MIAPAVRPATSACPCEVVAGRAMCANTMSHARPSLSEQILAAAQDGIICLDLAGRIKFANPAAARLLGCGAADELLDQPVRTYIQFAGLNTIPDEPTEATGVLRSAIVLLARCNQ